MKPRIDKMASYSSYLPILIYTTRMRSIYIFIFLYNFLGTAEAREPTEFLVHPEELEETQSISLTCNADVGRPRGNIQISKSFQTNSSELIYTSNYTNIKSEDCMEYVNVTFTVTREDNGAVFRCSSQNNFTKNPGPSKVLPKITVLCMYRFILFCSVYLLT